MAAQFDIARNLNRESRVAYPFLLILQSDQIDSLHSVIVAPLVLAAAGRVGKSRLHPLLEVAGQSYVVKMEDLASAPRAMIGSVVGSALPDRYRIVAALDLLFTGI